MTDERADEDEAGDDTRDIVAGVDGTESGLAAAVAGALEAQLRGLRLTLLRSIPYPFTTLMSAEKRAQVEFENQSAAERDIAAAVEVAHRAAPDIAIAEQVVLESPATALVSASAGNTLIVIGEHGHGALRGVLAGSTAVKVATHAECPVMVARGQAAPDGDVVLGTDGSPHSEAATAFAFEAAALRGTGVTAIRAGRHTESDDGDTSGGATSEKQDAETRELVESLAAWAERYPDVPVRHVSARGGAADALIEASAGARLVVVGARGRGGFPGLLLGSVSLDLLHGSACPVVIVRPQ